MPLPDKIQNAPDLEPGLQFYYSAWQDLHPERVQGMGVGPIPHTSILIYGSSLGLEPDEMDDLKHHIRAMDTEYLKWSRKKSKEGQQNGNPK